MKRDHPDVVNARRTIEQVVEELTPDQTIKLAAVSLAMRHDHGDAQWQLSSPVSPSGRPDAASQESSDPSVRIAAKLARLQIVRLDQWLAIEQVVDYCLEQRGERRPRQRRNS